MSPRYPVVYLDRDTGVRVTSLMESEEAARLEIGWLKDAGHVVITNAIRVLD